VTEDDAAAPDEVYGASKRAVELIGETLSKKQTFEFVALRIARVVGPGIKKTASPWRSQIFEVAPQPPKICIPFSPEAMLSLVHVKDVARMLFILANTTTLNSFVYNTPAEIWEVQPLKKLVEKLHGKCVELGYKGAGGGPCATVDVSRESSALDFGGSVTFFQVLIELMNGRCHRATFIAR
jgi:nucleoside-diphosphate-sugar epimerase